ncbi:MAG: MFS transporter [Dehalococcoidia bacterium]|nr:MFS transporter [Dehalococcoidia bacterium]
MSVASKLGSIRTFRALRHRNYRFLWAGQVGHSCALWMDQVARAVLVIQLTDSAFILSAVIATRLIPILLFGLLAGAIADRANRKRILMSTQLVTFSTHVFLGTAITFGFIEIWMVFATALVAGSAMAFNQPVRQSLVPMTVPREDLVNAIALNSTGLSLMRVGGGSLAGVLLFIMDTGGVYYVNAGVYVFVLFTTLMLQVTPVEPRTGEKKNIFGDLAEGFGYVRANPNLAVVVSLALILFVFGFPYQHVFTPLLATRTLGLGDSGVGFLMGAIGIGAVTGSLVVATRSAKRPGLQLMINMLVFGSALMAISLQSNVIVTAALLALCGAMTVTYIAFTNAILLDRAEPAMHGRVMSLLSLDRGLIPLGAILAGSLVSFAGVQPGLFTLGSIVVALSALALLVFGRRLASIRTGEYNTGPGAEAAPDSAGSRAPAQ